VVGFAHNFQSNPSIFDFCSCFNCTGRLRDGCALGSGSLVLAGTVGYCVGNLRLPSANHSWEDPVWSYPPNMAQPLEILIEASNGASDYGNKVSLSLLSV
jgi:phosphoribosylformylglycinamidine synthase